jgi:hypothetical protein
MDFLIPFFSLIKNNPNKYKTITKSLPSSISMDQIKLCDQVIAFEFKCSICKSIPLEPVKCEKCKAIFCKQEIEDRFKNSHNCLSGSYNISTNTISDLSQIEKNILSQLAINCDCGQRSLTFSNIKDHFKECKYNQNYSCLDCNAIKPSLKAMDVHFKEECPKAPVACEYCNIKVPKNEMQRHQIDCLEMCSDCTKIVPKNNFNEHKINECAGIVKRYYENILTVERDAERRKRRTLFDEIKVVKQENAQFRNYINGYRMNCENLKKKIERDVLELVDANMKLSASEISGLINKYNVIGKTEFRLIETLKSHKVYTFNLVVILILFFLLHT